MGDLHEGHLSLIRQSRKDNDITVLSVFVNPKQFVPGEDCTRYPRDKKKDEKLAKNEKVDIMFYPSEKKMYPTGYLTYVAVTGLADVLCGHSRPGHFRGVTTVVAKLLNVVMPDVLYLGQKDAQQAIVIRQMVEDLNFPTEIKIMPIVREKDGLAMSSRNRYLTPRQRREATVLYQSLLAARKQLQKGERKSARLRETVKKLIRTKSSARVEYVEFRHMPTLRPAGTLKGKILLALAVYFGRTRLIDNIVLRVP